jgi:uncharacterized cupredoxin-like copper-binding protein
VFGSKKLLTILVAVLAALSLAVAAGCGDDVESVVSDVTQAESGAPDPSAEEIAPEGTTEGGMTTAGQGASTGAETSGATTLEIPADEQALAFQKEQVTARAGEVTLRMPNPAPLPHNIAVDEPEQMLGEVVQKGGVSEITVNFPAGEYEYYCSVPGHREAGMVGTLTVQ